jgi:hypothetical protein
MSCEEKTRLAQNYRTATAKFADAVRQLQVKLRTSASTEHDRPRRISDEARLKSEQARLALEQHISAHDC